MYHVVKVRFLNELKCWSEILIKERRENPFCKVLQSKIRRWKIEQDKRKGLSSNIAGKNEER
jgi:hypothetical protein